MADPVLRIFTIAGTEVTANDDWDLAGAGDPIADVAVQVGAFELPRGSKDAALRFTVPPNSGYTIQISGKNGATGVVLAEVYEVP